MIVFLNLTSDVFRQGLAFGIMAIGVYITYKVLDFPDLSVEGTFPMGMCITATLIISGVNPWLTLPISFFAGAFAGCITGLLNVKFKIVDLLAGILVMTGLYSINFVILNGVTPLNFFHNPTIFNTGFGALFTGPNARYGKVIITLLIVVLIKIAVDVYLKTKSGLLLRASGNNPQYVTSLGKNAGNMKILGLAIGNGLTALSGCILAQQNRGADITQGAGMIVMALASVIIGITLFKRLTFIKATTAVVLGAIIYQSCLSIALLLGLPSNYIKLTMAVIFGAVLIADNMVKGRRKKRHVS